MTQEKMTVFGRTALNFKGIDLSNKMIGFFYFANVKHFYLINLKIIRENDSKSLKVLFLIVYLG